MRKFLTLVAIFLFLPAHSWYTGKLVQDGPYKGWKCCDGSDCKTVRAWPTQDGKWHFVYPDDGIEYTVPDYAYQPDDENAEPFMASACVYRGEVLCFWRKRAGG